MGSQLMDRRFLNTYGRSTAPGFRMSGEASLAIGGLPCEFTEVVYEAKSGCKEVELRTSATFAGPEIRALDGAEREASKSKLGYVPQKV